MNYLILRGLTYYWRTNAAVVAGVATAVAVLGGALLIGESVRGSLRDLVLQRLGRTDHVVVSAGFFRERLADDLRSTNEARASLTGTAPLIVLPGVATEQESRTRAGQVRVYGVDERFWQFHGVAAAGPADGEALVSPALAQELDARPGGTMLLRVQRPSDIPLESLHGRKEDLGRTLRLTLRAIVPASALGEFSLEAQQANVKAVFVRLSELQQALDVVERVNTILVSAIRTPTDVRAIIEEHIRSRATIDDVGLTLSTIHDRGLLAIGSDAGLLNDAQAGAVLRAADATAGAVRPVLTYLANTLRSGAREIPYSLVTAIDLQVVAPGIGEPQQEPAIVLNQWAAADLAARTGDLIAMEYYLWEEPGRRSACGSRRPRPCSQLSGDHGFTHAR